MDNQEPHKNNIFSKDNISTLLLSTFIAFFIAKFLDPVLSFFYSLLLNLGGNIIQSISNSTYREISNGVTEQTSSLILYLILLILCCALAYISSMIKVQYKKHIETYNNYKKDLSTTTKSVHEEKTVAESNPHPSNTEEKVQFINNSIDKVLRESKREHLFLQIIIICAYIILICAYSKNAFVHKNAVTLTNNIEIVSPYISDLEYKELKSAFYSMENSDDYNAIISSLTSIAEDNGINLKK